MTDNAFLDAVLAEPHEPAHKLEYSDWLDERGRGSEAFTGPSSA